MANLTEIREEIFGNNIAKRIVIKVRTKRLDSQDYRASASTIVSEIFPGWETDPRVLFLAIDVWRERTFIVIDINHFDYDFSTAHKITTTFPVYILRHASVRGWTLIRWQAEDASLGEKLAYLHNVNGFDAATPFLEDHNSRIVHANPREFSRSNQSVD